MTGRHGTKALVGALGAASLLVGLASPAAQACTGIRLTAQDGSVVPARTLEFAIDLKSKLTVVPRGYARTGTTPDGTPGLTWKAKYGSVGMNGVDLPFLFDGMNEKGLVAELFYFPTSAGYMAYAPADAGKTLAPWELGSWMLENFASVDEVKANVGKIVVPKVVFAAWGFAPEVHFTVHDASGKSIVIEYTGGKLNIYDSPLGVITNSPAFDWQMTNLRNYVNLSINNAAPAKVGPLTLQPFGQGSGMAGLPGDFTPPSRFVRAVAYSQSVLPSKTGPDAVLEAFHILNQFDIPKGAARDHEKDEHGNIVADYTLWTAASDTAARRYYFRTYENSQIRMVDLTKVNFDAPTVTETPVDDPEVIRAVTP